MIISRIAQSFRNGEWARLGLELLLIVVGIFLGLQAYFPNARGMCFILLTHGLFTFDVP